MTDLAVGVEAQLLVIRILGIKVILQVTGDTDRG
jgi:hypothetical protein